MKINSYQVADPQKLPYSSGVTWVLLFVCLLAVQYFLTMYLVTMRARMRTLTKDHMKQFAKEHSEAYGGQKPPQFGYPDSGNGRFAKKLPYLDWYDMNNGQRAQINFLEQITFVVGLALIMAANQKNRWASGVILAVYSADGNKNRIWCTSSMS